LVIHMPVASLPHIIMKMKHSETVCSYCGISYLIFHEFHQLQTQVAQFKAELQGLREKAKREKAQQEALELSRLEWERAFHLEGRKQVEVKEKKESYVSCSFICVCMYIWHQPRCLIIYFTVILNYFHHPIPGKENAKWIDVNRV
uniref:Leucine, glutamate and lysine rich 1 n=1 Tax=Labrus bergylta TaxID=56723 RepID=A0A3Q3M266_9LABR